MHRLDRLRLLQMVLRIKQTHSLWLHAQDLQLRVSHY